MAAIELGGKRGRGRVSYVSDSRFESLAGIGWRVKRHGSGYEQIIQSGRGGWRRPMARLIMEQIVGRPLRADEHVHHRDDDTFNNRDENLQLLGRGAHIAEHTRRNRSHERAQAAATKKRRADPSCGTYEKRTGHFSAYCLGVYLGSFATQEEAIACYRKALAEGVEAARISRPGNRSETSGAYLQPSGRWRAQFRAKGLGTYDTQEEALAVYRKAVADYEARR